MWTEKWMKVLSPRNAFGIPELSRFEAKSNTTEDKQRSFFKHKKRNKYK